MSEAAKKPIWKRWWFWVLAVIVIGAIGANSGENTSTETTTAPAQEQQKEQNSGGQQEAKKEEKKEQVKVYKVGDVVPVEKFEYKVNSIKTAKKIGNEFMNKTTNGQFLIINVTIKNNDKEARIIDTSLFKIIDSQGREFEPLADGDVYVNENTSFFLEEVNPNLSRTGNIVFEMPKDAKGLKLEVNSGVGLAAGVTALIDLGK